MKALVIDDEQGVRETIAANLRARAFAVDTAEDGTEGSYLARTSNYDVIILDNMLPEKNGFSVCEDIRRSGNTTPILVLSALSDAWRKVELLNAGADDYMIKPFSFEELMARIRALLRRPAVMEGDIITIDTLVLDTKQQNAKRGDASIYLTRKEYMLLEYLMRNRGSVLSRAMIMEHVWEMTSDPFSNTIESHILSLRKKIEGPDRKKLIHTVPSRGYRLDIAP